MNGHWVRWCVGFACGGVLGFVACSDGSSEGPPEDEVAGAAGAGASDPGGSAGAGGTSVEPGGGAGEGGVTNAPGGAGAGGGRCEAELLECDDCPSFEELQSECAFGSETTCRGMVVRWPPMFPDRVITLCFDSNGVLVGKITEVDVPNLRTVEGADCPALDELTPLCDGSGGAGGAGGAGD